MISFWFGWDCDLMQSGFGAVILFEAVRWRLESYGVGSAECVRNRCSWFLFWGFWIRGYVLETSLYSKLPCLMPLYLGRWVLGESVGCTVEAKWWIPACSRILECNRFLH